MPEILHSKEFDGDINIKKRLTKNLKKTYADIEPFGLTVGDAKSFDALLSATEDIETNAEIVVSKLDKGQATPENVLAMNDATKQIAEFFKSVRKGLNSVKSTKFKGLPRTDIEKLSNYLPSLQGYLTRFETLFGKIKMRNKPTILKYQDKQQELLDQIEEGQDLLLEAENNVRNGTNTADDDRIIEDYPPQLQGLRDDLALNRAQLIRAERTRDTPESRIKESTKEYFSKVADVDYGMILKNFTEFIQLLSDGISSFNSGRTTQGNLGGSYMIGGADYMPRRFM